MLRSFPPLFRRRGSPRLRRLKHAVHVSGRRAPVFLPTRQAGTAGENGGGVLFGNLMLSRPPKAWSAL